MPYIVTAYRDGPWPHTTAMRDVISRHAVATLGEARDGAKEACGQDLMGRLEASLLPESGGTVGPLPDGTVIEVERIGYDQLCYRADASPWPHPVSEAARSQLVKSAVNAFNARQS